MKTILITGINGFLGSNLARALSAEYHIIGLEYSMENLFRIADCNYKVYSAKDGIPEELFIEQSIDIIIHTATLYGKNNEDFSQMFYANLYSPFILLEKAILNGCQLFVNTDTVLDRFANTYALTKKQFQEWLYLRKYEIKVINMQLEHFYGPDASSDNFITSMINRLKNNDTQIDLTAGEQERDFIYIDDIISAFCITINKSYHLIDPYTNYQVCTGQSVKIKELLLLLKELTNSSSLLRFGEIPYRENELMLSKTSNLSLLELGWSPTIKIKDGLLKLIQS